MTDTYDLFCGFIREHRRSMFRVARSILRSDADAEDAVSEATVKAYMNFSRLRNAASFKPWIMRILVNEAYALIRKRPPCEALDDSIPDRDASLAGDTLMLRDAVNMLGDEFRSVAVLFYYEDLTIKEISRVLNIPVGTVNSRLNRARTKLRSILED